MINIIEHPMRIMVFLCFFSEPEAAYAVPPKPANASGTAAHIPQKFSLTSVILIKDY